MEVSHLERSPKVCNLVDENDAKYVSGLSALLVATIQEAKDRISQIEYVFCSQLYPNYQKNSKCLQNLYSEARRAAEDEFKGRENELELQVKRISLEKEQALEKNKALEVEKTELLSRIAKLEEKLLQKTKEVEDGMEFHGQLLNLVESKASIIANKEKQMKDYDERMKLLVAKVERLEGNLDALGKEINEKNEEAIKGKELREELHRLIESQALKIINTENENKQLAVQLENMEASFEGLKDELRRKTLEVDEGKKLQERLVQQVSLNSTTAHEKEKKILLSRISDLENKVQENIRNGIGGILEGDKYDNDLVQQIELKNSELLSEKQRRRDLTAAYKSLKSENNYLRSKLGLTMDNMLPQMKVERESDVLSHDNKSINPSEIKINPASNAATGGLTKVKEIKTMESSDEENDGRLNQISSSHSPSSSKSNSPAPNQLTTSRNLVTSAGIKRPASGWRETRSRQGPNGPDPHDDFLDPPYEKIRGNLHKAMKDSPHNIPAQDSKDMDSDSSNDATQDMKAEFGTKKQQLQDQRPGPKGFKYTEPVRKKSEREILNGIECKQCKKFYDAVLSGDGAKDGEINRQNLRCEHHDGVSRHRYRYAPPMTPEGFWNIGFDTET